MTTLTETTIRPYTVPADPLVVSDVRQRLRETRWPDAETDASQGIGLELTRSLVGRWLKHDWAATVTEINGYPNFQTEIDGLDIHFLHIRSRHPDARPLLLIHGWPSSIVEFLDVIDLLTAPDDPADAFHLVIPSLPGHGFSERPSQPGWGVERIASAFAALMRRLDYPDYVSAGGDWGSFVSAALGYLDAERIAGVHLTMPYAPKPAHDIELGERDQAALRKMYSFGSNRSGYAAIQSSRPQTLAYGLTDSPVGQLGFIAERFQEWADHDGDLLAAIPPDRLLDTVMVYWSTRTAGSAARLFWESWDKIPPTAVHVPTGCSVGPRDAWLPRAWCEQRFTDLRYWHDVPRGGHFPAIEVPRSFVQELQTFARTL